MDVMVYETQKWLNENYTGKNGYIPLDLSDESEIKGRTGWTTIYALLRAFQIRLGIEKPADSFGPATRAAFNSNFENGIIEQAEDSEEEDDIYAIIQGALWCKGYSTGLGTITRQFKKSVGDAIKLLKREAGLPDYTSTITLNIMESLLSMKQFRLVSGGDINIQAVQRKVNEKYVPYTGIVPCDGVYGREMNKALIQVLQCIEGLSPADATGNFGNYTKNNCPIISSTQPSNLSKDEYENAVQLIKFALTCNGYYPGSLDGTWSSAVTMHLSLFQEAHDLPQSPVCNLNTWMALLLSSGNPDRAAIACDTATILNEKMAQALYSAGYCKCQPLFYIVR